MLVLIQYVQWRCGIHPDMKHTTLEYLRVLYVGFVLGGKNQKAGSATGSKPQSEGRRVHHSSMLLAAQRRPEWSRESGT